VGPRIKKVDGGSSSRSRGGVGEKTADMFPARERGKKNRCAKRGGEQLERMGGKGERKPCFFLVPGG